MLTRMMTTAATQGESRVESRVERERESRRESSVMAVSGGDAVNTAGAKQMWGSHSLD